MYRDEKDAMAHQVAALSKEADTLRADNEAMRQQLLALRQAGGGGPSSMALPYGSGGVAHLSPGDRAALAHHNLTEFPVWAVAILHLMTFGLFSIIHFGLQHDKLPKAANNDPGAGEAIGFSFIPFFNLYWWFFNPLRLAERLNLQYQLRGEAPKAPTALMIACSVLTIIPWVNFFVGIPIMWTIGSCFLQSSINDLARMRDAAAPGQLAGNAAQPALDPYARPPAGLLPPG